jgi:hypothetical protein
MPKKALVIRVPTWPLPRFARLVLAASSTRDCTAFDCEPYQALTTIRPVRRTSERRDRRAHRTSGGGTGDDSTVRLLMRSSVQVEPGRRVRATLEPPQNP